MFIRRISYSIIFLLILSLHINLYVVFSAINMSQMDFLNKHGDGMLLWQKEMFTLYYALLLMCYDTSMFDFLILNVHNFFDALLMLYFPMILRNKFLWDINERTFIFHSTGIFSCENVDNGTGYDHIK